MPTYLVTETIAAAPSHIWPVLVDVSHWPAWTPTVSRIEARDGPTLAVGSRFKVFQPKLRPAVWTVTAISPPTSFTWVTRSLGLEMVAEHTLRSQEDGLTRLELRFTFAGMFGAIIGALARKVVMSYMSIEASKLKAAVQGQAAGKESVA